MKNSILLLTIALIIVSCNQTGKKTGTLAAGIKDSVAVFKPNPQRVPHQDVTTMAIGQKAVDFKLPDVTGRYYTLADFKKADVLVIVFTCNHCPTAQAYEDRIIRFTGDYKDKNVAVVAIMPNSMYSLLLEECGYSDLDDSLRKHDHQGKR